MTAMPAAALLAALLVASTFAAPAAARDMDNLAADIAALDARVSTFWPGYWPVGQPFVLYGADGCVMRSETAPGAEFEPIIEQPGFWRGRCEEKRFLGPMVLNEPIAGIDAPAVRLLSRRDRLARVAPFLTHEAFHAFQYKHFDGLKTPQSDFAFPLEQELVRMKLRETHFLLRASGMRDRTSQLGLVHAAIATRNARLARMPSSARTIEDSYLRNEGMAEYVDVRTAALMNPSERPSRRLQNTLRYRSKHLGRTWEYLLRWQSYAVGAAAGLLLDRWQVDWKPQVMRGTDVYAILETASSYDDARRDELQRTSRDAQPSAEYKTARDLVHKDLAAQKGLRRYQILRKFALEIIDSDTSDCSFTTNEIHSVTGGTLVMRPMPLNCVSQQYELRVNARPVRLWNRDENDPASKDRIEVALPSAPDIDGPTRYASRYVAGTRLRAHGMELELKADYAFERSDRHLLLRPLPSPQ